MSTTAHPLSYVQNISKLDDKDYDTLLPILEEHEALARFTSFTADDAFELGSTIRSTFTERYKGIPTGIVVKIQLWNEHVLFTAIAGDAPQPSAGNWFWASAKYNTVKKMSMSSLRTGLVLGKYGKTPEEVGIPFPEHTCAGGGFPLWIKGVNVGPIGAILVSGLPALEDHQLIIDSIAKCSHLLAPA